jgi:hypothetical protein
VLEDLPRRPLKRTDTRFQHESPDTMNSKVAKPTIDERGFWLTHDEGHDFDPELACALVELFAGSKVCDLGCGQGKYVRFLRDGQIDCDGFDGNPNTPQMTHGMCGVVDLSQPIRLQRKYDTVMSLEVAEHIPREFQDVYLANLTVHAQRKLVLSWAIPGQAGDGHVNNRSNSFAVWKLRQLGFQLDVDESLLLRERASLVWFKSTILVFSRRRSASSVGNLEASLAALRMDFMALGRKVKTVASEALARAAK